MEDRPFFSIITVSLNPGSRLFDTLNSIVSQQFLDIEWIVKDGNSTDGTLEWLKEIDIPFRHLTTVSPDTGIYDAMNQAVKMVRGQFLLFLNCGDILADEDVLCRAKTFIESTGEYRGIYYGDMINKATGVKISATPKITDFSLYRNQPCHQSVFYARDCFLERGFDTDLKIRADHEHMLYCYKILKIPYFYFGFFVCIFEGGGLSDNPQMAKLQKKELRSIAKRHLGKSKANMYAVIMLITLAPLRKLLVKNKVLGGTYEAIKNKIYILRG